MSLNFMTPEFLFKEIEGTLTSGEDPSGAGSQASVYDYLLGDGVSFIDKLDRLNALRDENDARPIKVNVRPPDKVGPGVIAGTIPIQLLKESVNLDEDDSMERLTDIGNGIPTETDRSKWQYAKLAVFAGTNDAPFMVTDRLTALLLDAVPGSLMPITRDELIKSLSVDGSRAQQQEGRQYTQADLISAEEWGQANGKPTLYE